MNLNASRLELFIIALRGILPLTEPADVYLRYFFRDHPKLGVQDRAFVAENVFAVLRRRRLLEYLCENPTPRALALAALVKLQGLNLREIEPFVTEEEAKWLKQVKAASVTDLSPAVKADLPDWLYEKLADFSSPEEITKLAAGLNQPASLDLRVNTVRASRDEILQKLIADGFQAEATPYSPLGIRLKNKPMINQHSLFLDGSIEIQDEGSQLLGFLVAPKRNDMVVDFCAGAGGKTLLLGAMMQSRGRIYAFDVSEKRLQNLKPRLKRSGLSNLHPQLIQNENDLKIKRLSGKIDRVLVDSPCSGLGTLRRNPDLKWRQSPESVAELNDKQRRILASAANLLKPGGRLVYATCSILPEENQAIVEAFLAQHPDFKLLDASEILAQQHIQLSTGKYFQLFPHVHGTDGFFSAVMEKMAKVPE